MTLLHYEVETKVLNQAVKRNAKRFPADFMFRLTTAEWQHIRSQTVTASANPQHIRSQIVTASQRKRNTQVTPPLRLYRTGRGHA